MAGPARARPASPSHRAPRARLGRLLGAGAFCAALGGACRSSEAPLASDAAAPLAAAAPARERRDEPAEPSAAVAARLGADVAWLADDAREGRRAGTAGEAAAAEWIAARCAELGLEPAGEQGFFQAFAVDLPALDGGASSVRAEGFAAAACAPLFCAEGGTARGPLVFAGYGIAREERAWDDWAGLAVEGSVVLVVRGTPRLAEPAPEPAAAGDPHGAPADTGWGDTGGIFFKVMEAKRRGACAVLLAPHPDDAAEPLLSFDAGQTARAGIPAVMIGAADAAALVPGYGERVRGFDAGERGAGPPLETAGAREVEVRADVVREKGTARNVLARCKGGRSDLTVVLGAHFDHLGRGGIGSLANVQGEIHNGADDNASGTALVLELARQLAAGDEPPGDVLFALWSGEELGLLGSEHWLQHPTVPLASVRCNLNFDMVGRAAGGGLDVLGAGTAEPLAKLLDELAPESGLELRVSGAGQGVGGSDHQSFLKREVPALHFFSGLHAEYHTPADDAALFEPEAAARVASLALSLVRRIQSAPALSWTPPPADAEQPAPRGGFKTMLGGRPEYGYAGPGVLLGGTTEGSPAQRAGLLAGDVLVGLGDVAIGNIHDYVYALQRYKPGDVVQARYLRDGSEHAVQLTLLSREIE